MLPAAASGPPTPASQTRQWRGRVGRTAALWIRKQGPLGLHRPFAALKPTPTPHLPAQCHAPQGRLALAVPLLLALAVPLLLPLLLALGVPLLLAIQSEQRAAPRRAD